MSVYTVYPNKKPTVDVTRRMLSLQDFPEPVLAPLMHHKNYLVPREIVWGGLSDYSAYLTTDGVCFLLTGCLGYQVRVTLPGALTRFLFPGGVPLRSALYVPTVTRLWGQELVIVEGTTDALAVAQLGYRTVSLLGSSVTPEKIAGIKGLMAEVPGTTPYIIPDNDLPGIGVVEKLCDGGIYPRLLYLPSYAKDICELGVVERLEFLEKGIGW